MRRLTTSPLNNKQRCYKNVKSLFKVQSVYFIQVNDKLHWLCYTIRQVCTQASNNVRVHKPLYIHCSFQDERQLVLNLKK